MNQQTFEQFFQKPEGFIWSEDLQCYYEHQDYRFKYPLEAIGEFNLKWQGWLAAHQVMTNKPMTAKLIPWDEMIHILNRLQANHPGPTMEYVNKWVNDEIYEYFENKAYEEEQE